MRPTFYKIVPILFFAIISNLLAQDTDVRYTYTQRGDRLEGLNFVHVNVPDFELVSFTSYRELNQTNNQPTKLDFYLPQSAKVHILVQEVLLIEYYQMRPIQVDWSGGWNTYGPWSTDLIANVGLSPENLAMIGRVGTKEIGSGNIVPLSWYTTNPADAISQYSLICRANEAIYSLDVKVLDSNNQTTFDKIYYDIGKGMPFEISLDFERLAEGSYTILIDGKYEHKLGGPKRRFTFYHKPNRQ
ncbi:hypothetical protein QQ008_10915 [Fulvivirgaceae bacterium BMA10]|uniref:Uncharacterized protein n=1 Tax=Splendidivirga corallicola TaxID=3051826 RepID=A0ABT8KMC5_9BACT|nr:hypothetical protein [Fulvivirgaceae bacterium BMA10]